MRAVLARSVDPESPERGRRVPAVGRAGGPGHDRRRAAQPAARARRRRPRRRRRRDHQRDGDLGARAARRDRRAPGPRRPPGSTSPASSSSRPACWPRSAGSAGSLIGSGRHRALRPQPGLAGRGAARRARRRRRPSPSPSGSSPASPPPSAPPASTPPRPSARPDPSEVFGPRSCVPSWRGNGTENPSHHPRVSCPRGRASRPREANLRRRKTSGRSHPRVSCTRGRASRPAGHRRATRTTPGDGKPSGRGTARAPGRATWGPRGGHDGARTRDLHRVMVAL